ncbi:MAG: hypothetical protein ACOYBU_13985 [Dermatophilaceae bacterium]
MAFPTLVGTASWTGSTLAHKAQMPTGIVAGDLIVALWHRTGGTGAGTIDPAFTEIVSGAGTNQGGRMAYKVATGAESGALLDIALLTGSNANGASITVVLRDWSGTPAGAWDAGTGSTTIDPPALTSGLGNVDTTWLIYAGSGNQASVPVTLPAGYGGQVSDGRSGAAAAMATRNLKAASEDPGACTWAGGLSINGVTATLAVAGITAPTAQPRAQVVVI